MRTLVGRETEQECAELLLELRCRQRRRLRWFGKVKDVALLQVRCVRAGAGTSNTKAPDEMTATKALTCF